MPKPTSQKPGRPHLQRDNQQWVYDYVIQQTNRVFHWQAGNGSLPKSVRSHAMISKHVGKQAERIESLARTELAAGHPESALELYVEASGKYSRAQHPIFELNEEKKFLYAGLRRCWDQVIALNSYRIETIEIPWEGTLLTGFLHHNPHVKGKAPLLIRLGGCDVTQETEPNPLDNKGHHRGFHVFTLDGPGLGQSNMRGIKLTGSNFAPAATAALDVLVKRPEIDADKVGLLGTGGGSIWGMRWIAEDHRVKAAATASTYTDPFTWMNVEAPRWKQLFAFLTQSTSEAELDKVMAEMQVSGHVGKITCPTLMVSGEYDMRDPIDEVFEVFDELKAPGELWVFADQFHGTSLAGGGHEMAHTLMIDWVKDRLEGKPIAQPGKVVYLEPNGNGPNAPTTQRKRKWFQTS